MNISMKLCLACFALALAACGEADKSTGVGTGPAGPATEELDGRDTPSTGGPTSNEPTTNQPNDAEEPGTTDAPKSDGGR